MLGVVAACFLIGWQTSAPAPTDAPGSASNAVPRVVVGEITGNPGNSLMIPLYYTPYPNVPLRSFTVEIEYVSNSLKFKRAEKGTAAESAGAEVEAVLTDGAADPKGVTRSKLRLTLSLTDKQPQRGLPEGLLAYLLFQLSTQAKPFVIKLNTAVVSAQDIQNPPRKVSKVYAKAGTVVVELADVNPEATCFFFSH